MNALAADGERDAGSRDVLGDVALLHPHHDDLFDAAALQRLDLGRPDRRSLLQHQRSLAQGVDGYPADRVLGARRAELHAASSFSLGGSLSTAVISAMIDTAISEGETAPIASPVGPWMRAISASLAPCPRSRSPRLACVFREPSAPI